MCGIVGFSGRTQAVPVLLEVLTHLEYRGYDSSGVAFFEDGRIKMIKAEGNLSNLKAKLEDEFIDSNCGIGHTRWATHGNPTERNAHPHGTHRVAVVHNGIIENADKIKEFLLANGYNFLSDTDTEVCAKLLDYYFGKTQNPVRAVNKLVRRISGSYAICAVFYDFSDRIYAFRKDNPLVVTKGKNGNFVCSDISALSDSSGEYYSVEEGEVAEVSADCIGFYDSNANPVSKTTLKQEVHHHRADKGDYEHFMHKEIFEQPQSVRKTVSSLLDGGCIDLGIDAEILGSLTALHIVACGTAYNASLVAKYTIEALSGIPVYPHLASEFLYGEPIVKQSEMVLFVSQSGETADTLSALRFTKSMGIRTLAIVNSYGSAIALEADDVIYTRAEREIAVASTKAYSVQLAVLYIIGIKIAQANGSITDKTASAYTDILLNDIPSKISEALCLEDICKQTAQLLSESDDIFYIGRGADYAQGMEGALKTKEISYIHCEAYAAGELKHGSIALIEDGTPVVAILTKQSTKDKIINNIREVKARGARVILLVSENAEIDIADEVIKIPETEEFFMPLICAPVLQLIAYYVALSRGLDADKPRNLAKSVTVE